MKIKILIKTLVVSFLIFSFSTQIKAQKRIAVIGSSSVAGYFPPASGFPKDSAWVYKLKKYYKDLGLIDTLYNLGQSSTDCFEGMPSSYVPPSGYRLPNPNINITKAINMIPKPDVIIVSYPSNNYDWISTDQVINCLQIMKDSANANNITCYITSTQPRNTFSPSERLKLKTLRNLIIDHFGQFAIDFFTDIVEEPSLNILPLYNIGDGIHLTPAGHTVLKDKVLEKNILSGILPLKFTQFKLISFQQKVIVKWETQNEEAQQLFIIEHSLDGRNFSEIGRLAGKNAPLVNEYEFVHKPNMGSTQFYRIQSLSTNGNKTYSSIAKITAGKSILPVQIKFIQPQLVIYFNEGTTAKAIINIFASNGKLVQAEQRVINGTDIIRLKINNLPPGNYTTQISYHSNKYTGRFVIP